MCVVEIHVHARASTKICHAHIPTCLVGRWDRGPLGYCGNLSPLLGNSREHITIYILSCIHAHSHVYTRPLFTLFLPLSLQARKAHMTFNKGLENAPSQHAAPGNGNTGYCLVSENPLKTLPMAFTTHSLPPPPHVKNCTLFPTTSPHPKFPET